MEMESRLLGVERVLGEVAQTRSTKLLSGGDGTVLYLDCGSLTHKFTHGVRLPATMYTHTHK